MTKSDYGHNQISINAEPPPIQALWRWRWRADDVPLFLGGAARFSNLIYYSIIFTVLPALNLFKGGERFEGVQLVCFFVVRGK